MISIFGAISLVVLVVCVAALVLHFRVLKKRSQIDDAMSRFDELLRDRLEMYIDLAEDIPGDFEEIENLCESYVFAETRQIIKSWAKIERAVAPLKTAKDKKEALTQMNREETRQLEEPSLQSKLSENAKEIDAMVRDYNDGVVVYNENISRFPGKIVALAVGFTAAKPMHFSYMTDVDMQDTPIPTA